MYTNTNISPRIKTSLVLFQTTANYTVSWANPGAARTLSIIDPGANDSFLFSAATQNISNKTLASNLAAGGFKITGLADPTSPQDAATKAYTDANLQGLSPKRTAVARTAAALPTNTYSNGTSGVGATLTASANGVLTVDGVTIAAGDVVLVMNETTGANNGLYTCTTAGAAGAAYVLTRAAEMDSASEFKGAYILVLGGTTYADTAWLCSNTSPPTVGTTSITFVQFASATAYTAGNGITISGNTVSVNLASSSGLKFVSQQLLIDNTITADLTSSQSLTNKTFGSGNTWNGNAISDTYIATPYIKADGTRALTGNWAAGAFGANFNGIQVGYTNYQANGSDDSTVNSTAVTTTLLRGGNKTGGSGTSGLGGQLSLIGGSATGASSTGGGGNVLLAGGSSIGGASGTVNIGDGADNTKRVGFSVNSATTATKTTLVFAQSTNQTLTFPDITDTVVTRTNTETLSNKNLVGPIYQSSRSSYSANQTLTGTSSEVLNVTTGSGSIVMTLPTAASCAGRKFRLRKVDSGSGNTTFAASGGDSLAAINVGGYSTDEQWGVVEVESDGVSVWAAL